MPFIKKINQDFILENERIILSKDYLNKNRSRFKKITGSRFAAILNQSTFTSPVKAWAMMVNIYTEPMDETFALAGNVIEPKIKEWVEANTNIEYTNYEPAKIGFDIFKENKVFGGIPDGEPVDDNGNLLYPNFPMLEIKTSSIDSFVFKKEGTQFVLQKKDDGTPIVKNVGEKKAKWFDNEKNIIVPSEYMFQLGLYCYLRNISHGIFAICFLETKDYQNPYDCDVNNRDIHVVDFDVNLLEFKTHINYAIDWFERFIETGVSPKLSKSDLEWFNAEVNNA